jgi:hypothetical protein
MWKIFSSYIPKGSAQSARSTELKGKHQQRSGTQEDEHVMLVGKEKHEARYMDPMLWKEGVRRLVFKQIWH